MAIVTERSNIRATLFSFSGNIMVSQSEVLENRVNWAGNHIVSTRSYGYILDN